MMAQPYIIEDFVETIERYFRTHGRLLVVVEGIVEYHENLPEIRIFDLHEPRQVDQDFCMEKLNVVELFVDEKFTATAPLERLKCSFPANP